MFFIVGPLLNKAVEKLKKNMSAPARPDRGRDRQRSERKTVLDELFDELSPANERDDEPEEEDEYIDGYSDIEELKPAQKNSSEKEAATGVRAAGLKEKLAEMDFIHKMDVIQKSKAAKSNVPETGAAAKSPIHLHSNAGVASSDSFLTRLNNVYSDEELLVILPEIMNRRH